MPFATTSARYAEVVGPAKFCAVVKADGYGHGDVPVAAAALEAGADWLAVATVTEGMRLREAGIDAPILLLSEATESDVPTLIAERLTPTVYSEGFLNALAACDRRAGRSARQARYRHAPGRSRRSDRRPARRSYPGRHRPAPGRPVDALSRPPRESPISPPPRSSNCASSSTSRWQPGRLPTWCMPPTRPAPCSIPKLDSTWSASGSPCTAATRRRPAARS